ncbi:MAG: hypothetical protein PW844_17075 [Pantoea sp.]|uniref:hypothetical protein n=1 Tax=Pantoea sp. TaxID=69393 RepID=UPI002389F632|nr:hypothetical protein [Pantoea sp.]MDE1188180.1 hypothetical protein [Pantoea sp.]
MPRYSDIKNAFYQSIKMDQKGQKTVNTTDFVAELERHHHHWSLKQANDWIENQMNYFRDITPDFSENRTFCLFNPNGPY